MRRALLLLACALGLACAERYVWIGAVTATSFVLKADAGGAAEAVARGAGSELAAPAREVAAADYGQLRAFAFERLQPATLYDVLISGEVVATVRTFMEEGDAGDVVFALGGCQYLASKGSAWEDIDQFVQEVDGPFVMLHSGDLHYQDIGVNDTDRFESATREVVTTEEVHNVFKRVPVVYMHDDHDYGGNDADFRSPSRGAAIANYRAMVPSYNSTSSDQDALYHAFTIGTVRVIVTDLRSFSEMEARSTLGSEQRQWLLNELKDADSYNVVVWVSSKPWIGADDPGDDTWAGFPEERRSISNLISSRNITNLIVSAGDAHMLAADDGTHSDYSDESNTNPAGFPVLHSGPLANLGSGKGGPYTEGCHAFKIFPNYQYSILRLTNLDGADGEGPCMDFRGYKAGERDEPVVTLKKCGQLGGVRGVQGGGQDKKCKISLAPWWFWFVLVIAVLLVIAVVLLCCCCCKRRKVRKTMWRQRSSRIGEIESITTNSQMVGADSRQVFEYCESIQPSESDEVDSAPTVLAKQQ